MWTKKNGIWSTSSAETKEKKCKYIQRVNFPGSAQKNIIASKTNAGASEKLIMLVAAAQT